MEAEAGRKRRADVPFTEAQEREAAAMLLPTTLPFKLKQAEGRTVRNHKVRRRRLSCRARASRERLLRERCCSRVPCASPALENAACCGGV